MTTPVWAVVLAPLFSFVALLTLASGANAAESRIEKTLTLPPGGRFVLDSELGAVTVTSSQEPGARIVVTWPDEDISSKLDISFEETPGVAKVTARQKGHGLSKLFQHGHGPEFEIQVPVRTELEVKTGGGGITVTGTEGAAALSTAGGGIEVTNLTGQLRAETSGGSVTLKKLRGDADARTSGGNIQAEGIEGSLKAHTSGGGIAVIGVSGDLLAKTSGGSIQIEEAAGKVDAETSGGSVKATLARGNGNGGRLATNGGGITVRLDPSVHLSISGETSAGTVHTDLPLETRNRHAHGSISGALGGGTPDRELQLRTDAGSISVLSL